jgi:hypothetical protein
MRGLRKGLRTRMRGAKGFMRGSTRPGVLDVLTALILLAILAWASWLQFPAYDRNTPPAGRVATTPRAAAPGK